MKVLGKNVGSIFIGHGRSDVWKELKEFLTERLDLRCDEFNLVSPVGLTTTQRLQEMLRNAAFAFLVMTGEDKHADGTVHARENVIYELGLFAARLGHQRAVILLEEGCAEFSNITGLTQIRFSKGSLGSAFEPIREVLEREGIIAIPRSRVPWWKRKSFLFAIVTAFILLGAFWIRLRHAYPGPTSVLQSEQEGGTGSSRPRPTSAQTGSDSEPRQDIVPQASKSETTTQPPMQQQRVASSKPEPATVPLQTGTRSQRDQNPVENGVDDQPTSPQTNLHSQQDSLPLPSQTDTVTVRSETNGIRVTVTIEITNVPPAGPGGPDRTEPISGKVRGVKPGKHKVVVYAFAGGTWWVQPTVAAPLTDLDESGGWQTITHLASTYAVLLVTPGYKPPATMSDVPKAGGEVLAVKLVQAGR